MTITARPYTTQVSGIAISVAQDLAEIQPADDKPVELAGCEIAQYSDLQDAAEEVLRTAIRRGNTSSGSGGTTPTIRATNVHDAAGAMVVEANNTTKASTAGGTHNSSGWNIRIAPTIWWWPDNFPMMATQAETTLCHELVAAPTDAVSCEQTHYMKEY